VASAAVLEILSPKDLTLNNPDGLAALRRMIGAEIDAFAGGCAITIRKPHDEGGAFLRTLR